MTILDVLTHLLTKLNYYFFYRSAFQWQMIVLLLALVAGWFISRRTVWLLNKLLPDDDLEADPHVTYAQEFGPDVSPPDPDETAQPAPVKEMLTFRQRVIRFTRIMIPNLALPITILLTVALARTLLAGSGAVVGLLDQLLQFLPIFMGYRLLVGLIDFSLPLKQSQRYHYQLLAPGFAVFIAYQALAWFFDPLLLGQVVLFDLFDNAITISSMFLATVGLYLWFQAIWVVQDVLDYFINQYTEIDPGAADAGLTLMRYGLIVVGLLVVFSELNFSPTAVAAITAGVTTGLAFGSREIINNFIGGILLLFEQSVRPGDTIEVSGTMGVVSAVNIRSTVVQAYDGREVIVPNSQMLTTEVVTYTKSSRHARIRIDIGVSYEADPRQVLELLREIPHQHENVLDDPEPNAFLLGFGASSVDFVLFAWVADLNLKFLTAHDLYFMIWDTLAEHNIEIPYPKQDVYLRQTPSAAAGTDPDAAPG